MSTLPRMTEGRRGLTPFRLSDVPLKVRRSFGDKLIEIAAESADAYGAVMLARAVEEPSERVYWVPTWAWETAASKRWWK